MASRLDNTYALSDNTEMRKTFKYRLYPNKQQQRLLEQQLEECRWLYNELLAARRDACAQSLPAHAGGGAIAGLAECGGTH